MKPRTCYKCRKTIPFNEGYKFDGCNLICGNCGEVAFEGNIPKKDIVATPEDTKCETQDRKPCFV